VCVCVMVAYRQRTLHARRQAHQRAVRSKNQLQTERKRTLDYSYVNRMWEKENEYHTAKLDGERSKCVLKSPFIFV